MIVTSQNMTHETRKNMRGGKGSVEFFHPIAARGDLPEKCRLFAEIVVPSGASMGYHEHSGETEFYYVLEGEGILDDGHSRSVIRKGDTVVTGNGAGHSVENESGADLKMLACIVLD